MTLFQQIHDGELGNFYQKIKAIFLGLDEMDLPGSFQIESTI